MELDYLWADLRSSFGFVIFMGPLYGNSYARVGRISSLVFALASTSKVVLVFVIHLTSHPIEAEHLKSPWVLFRP